MMVVGLLLWVNVPHPRLLSSLLETRYSRVPRQQEVGHHVPLGLGLSNFLLDMLLPLYLAGGMPAWTAFQLTAVLGSRRNILFSFAKDGLSLSVAGFGQPTAVDAQLMDFWCSTSRS